MSVHQAPNHSVFEGRVAMPVRQISSRIPERLRLTGHQHGAVDDVCAALEFLDAPLPLPPSVLPTQADSDMDVQATVLDRPSSPPLCPLQDQYDPAMGSAAEVGGTVPESDSSSTLSVAADGVLSPDRRQGSMLMVPQVRVRAVAVGTASSDSVNLHGILRRRAIVIGTDPTFLKGAFTTALRVVFEECIAARRMGTRHGKSERFGSKKAIGGAFQKFRSRGVGVGAPEHPGC